MEELGQLISESDALEGLDLALRRPLYEVLTALRKGGLLLKHGRHGKPKVHYFRLAGGDTMLRWKSASGSVKSVRLRSVVEVVAGQQTEYVDDEGAARTLDLTCPDQAQREVWFAGLKVVVARLRVAGAPAPLAASVAAAADSFSFFGGGAGSSPAETPRGVGAGFRPGGAGAAAGLPAPDHPPGDLLAWGSAQRGGAAPTHSARSGVGPPEDCWQRGAAPAAPPFGAWLDVHRAAVGRKHAAVVTATGALYTWGEGKGGKLGLGHDQDRPAPARLSQGLGGQCVVAVACGDDCTAALTAGGTLYMWGWLPGASSSRPLLVPVPMRGGLAGKRVVQVGGLGEGRGRARGGRGRGGEGAMRAATPLCEGSVGAAAAAARALNLPWHAPPYLPAAAAPQVSCGPFHCAAVAADGQLFTWGEGFGGKLGHGDQVCRAHPTLVSALAGARVLEVACGVWHTAAIAVGGDDGGGGGDGTPGAPGEAGGGADGLGQPSGPPGGAEGAAALSPPRPPSAHHARNSSTSSVVSDASLYHEGSGGALFTWGGVSESVVFGGEGDKEKRDSNKGCLGHGYDDLYRGQLLPERVRGALEPRAVRHVAAGSHLTVAVTTGGRVFQMGVTGVSAGKACPCPWEGAVLPELVRGGLTGVRGGGGADWGNDWGTGRGTGKGPTEGRRAAAAARAAPRLFVDEVACGMHHVVAVARPTDRRTGRPADHGPSLLLAWGRGSEGQLGTRSFEDSATPLVVDGLKGRHVLQVSAGGCNTLAVCQNDGRRFEPEPREEGEAAARALAALADGRPASAGGGAGERPQRAASRVGELVRRSLSAAVRDSGGAWPPPAPHSAASGGGGSAHGGAPGPWGSGGPSLGRISSGSVRSLPAAPSGSSQLYASLVASQRGQAPQRSASQQPRAAASAGGWGQPPRGLPRGGSDRTLPGGEPVAGPGRPHVVSLSPSQSAAPGGGGAAVPRRTLHASRSFTAATHLSASELSSLSSLHRPLSDDGAGGACGACGDGSANGHEAESHSHSGGGALTSAELAAIDEIRSASSVATLQEELGEKTRRIERLEARVAKLQRAAARGGGGSGDADERLREAVRSSAGAFRDAQAAAAAAGGGRGPGGWEATAAAAGRRAASGGLARQATPAGPPPLGRPSVSFSEAGTAASRLDEEHEASLRAMEQALAKRQQHLESQQQQLAQWAAELQRREAELARRHAALVGGGSSGAHGGGAAAAAAGPGLEPVSYSSPGGAGAGASDLSLVMGTPKASGGGLGAAGSGGIAAGQATPGGAAPAGSGAAAAGGGTPGGGGDREEYTEEFEEGVFLTFTAEAEGGGRRLKRIRFSRTRFDKEAASQWYELNKGRLGAQPTGALRAGSAQLVTPARVALAPAPAAAAAAPPAGEARGACAGGERGGAPPPHAGGVEQLLANLHHRQTSRNLSFDARDLADFHERLMAAQAAEGGGGGARLPPSRLARPGSRFAPPREAPERGAEQQREGTGSSNGDASGSPNSQGFATARGEPEGGEAAAQQPAPSPAPPAGWHSATSLSSPGSPASPVGGEPSGDAPGSSGATSPIRASMGGGGGGGGRAPSPAKASTAGASGALGKQGGGVLRSPKGPEGSQGHAAAGAVARRSGEAARRADQFSPRFPAQRASSAPPLAAAGAGAAVQVEGEGLHASPSAKSAGAAAGGTLIRLKTAMGGGRRD
eukprot:scaffold2.g6935.t1